MRGTDGSRGGPSRVRRPTGPSAIPDKLIERGRSSGKLGVLLAWAVVYADIGTSVYYVPGLLFVELGSAQPSPAGAFVFATGVAFVLLVLKYVTVTARYAEGGGVVSVASDAFGPYLGCLGGILICVDYFLTGAISSVSGFEYLAGEFQPLGPLIVPAACAALVLLGVLNYVGIRESAVLTLFLAIASFATNMVVIGFCVFQLDASQWQLVLDQFRSVKTLSWERVLMSYASSWLAFSGLESISQIAPALQPPRERTALKTMLIIIVCIFLTDPVMTVLSTALLDASRVRPERFVFELGTTFGPHALRYAILFSSSTLLLGAANTAIIGCYHVFLALVGKGFMPQWLAERSHRFGTPHRAIAIAVLIPCVVIVFSRAQMTLLGDMYAFGLLGAFTLTSLGLDKLRWEERARGPTYWLGIITTLLVIGAWVINLFVKHLATIFGGSVTVVGFAVALAVKKGWLRVGQKGLVSAEAAERAAAELESALDVVTVDEAVQMRPMYASTTLVAMRGPNLRLFQEATARVRGSDERAVYVLIVDEVPGLFFPPKVGPSRDARAALATAVDYFKEADIVAIPIWRMAHDAGASIAGAARRLAVGAVLVGTSQRSAIWHLLRGNVLKSLMRDLPPDVRIWICN